MAEDHMNISVNGQTHVPPGFRFYPTEEELLQYYLKKKVSSVKIDLDVIRDVDLNKLEPWDIQEKCKIGTTHQNDWYFFSHKDKKYPTGTRTNRATAAGFWKATGRDKVIYSNSRRIGLRKTLVFYKGRAPHGQKSDWIMHEYRLEDDCVSYTNAKNCSGETAQEDGWVVCRVFKKKNQYRTLESRIINISMAAEARMHSHSSLNNEASLDQLFQCMGRTFMDEKETNTTKLPSLDQSPNPNFNHEYCYQLSHSLTDHQGREAHPEKGSSTTTNQAYYDITNWSALDHFVASQPYYGQNQSEIFRQISFSNDAVNNEPYLPLIKPSSLSSSNSRQNYHASMDYINDGNLLNFITRSSSLATSDDI